MLFKKTVAWITVVAMLATMNVADGVAGLLHAAASVLTVGALAEEGDFVIDENGVLTRYNGADEVVRVPNAVTGIAAHAFQANASIATLVLPDSVEEIGESAFSSCGALSTLELGSGLKRIGNRAFNGCTSLMVVELPAGLETIGADAFNLCAGLEEIVIPEHVTSVGSGAFYGCGALTKATLPEGLTEIGDGMFHGCGKLASANIPESVTRIGKNAFRECKALTEALLPEGVTEIGETAFKDCVALSALELGNSLKRIGSYAFSGCASLTAATFPEGLESIGYQAFQGAPLEKVELPDTVTSLGDGAFTMQSCREFRWTGGIPTVPDRYFNVFNNGSGAAVEKVVIPEGVTALGSTSGGYGPFYRCGSLREVELPDTLKHIGRYSFYSCTALERVSIPQSVAFIGSYAFNGCSSLEEANLPESLTEVGENVFENCKKLANLAIPRGIRKIRRSAFQNCEAMTKVIIPDGVSEIGQAAFAGCKALSELELSPSVKNIGVDAFNDCPLLADVWLPDEMAGIGRNAFACRLHLASEDCITARQLSTAGLNFYVQDDEAFALRYQDVLGTETLCLMKYTGSDTAPELPERIEYIEQQSFSYGSVSRIEIDENIFRLPKWAFYHCSSLLDVYLPRSLEDIDQYAFYGINRGATFHVFSGSYGEEFARARGFNTVLRDTFLRVTAEQDVEGLAVRVQADGIPAQTRKVENGMAAFSIQSGTTCSLELLNACGVALARRDDVRIEDGRNEVVFDERFDVAGVRAVVRDADTQEALTDRVGIRWSREDGSAVAEGDVLSVMPVGDTLRCEVILDEALARDYGEVAPMEWTIRADEKYLSIPLRRYETRRIAGTVQNAAGAVVTAEQYTEVSGTGIVTSAGVDNSGRFALELPALDASLEISAPGYAAETLQAPVGTDDVGTVTLAPIEGARLPVTASLTCARREGATAKTESLPLTDLRIQATNVTTGQALPDAVASSDAVIFPSGVSAGDQVRVEFSGDGIVGGEVTAELDSDMTASAELSLTEMGGAVIRVEQAPDFAVRMLAFGPDGKLFSEAPEADGAFALAKAPAGSYTVLLMQESGFVDAPEDIADLPAFERTELVVNVEDGVIAEPSATSVPRLDESAFYAARPEQVVFRFSKASTAVGRNVTLTACAPLSDGASGRDFRWVFELPKQLAYVEDTLSIGGDLAYDVSFSDGTMTVPVDDPGRRTRFCLRPVSDGSYAVRAWLEYEQAGRVRRQPVGSADIEAEGLKLCVQGTTSEPRVYAYGYSPLMAEVNIYDGNTLVGTTATDRNGKWGCWVDLVRPGTYSTHRMQAVYTSFSGLMLYTAPHRVVYTYMNEPVRLKQVRMCLTHDEEAPGSEGFADGKCIVFDFEDPARTTRHYSYAPSQNQGHFLVLLEGDTSDVSRVKVNVMCSDGSVRTLWTEYSEELGGWHCVSQFSKFCMPAVVTVHYVNGAKPVIDDSYSDFYANLQDMLEKGDPGQTIQKIELSRLGQVDEEVALAVDAFNGQVDALRAVAEAGQADAAHYRSIVDMFFDDSDYSTLSGCGGVNLSALEADGFEKYDTVNDGVVYMKYDDETSVMEVIAPARDIHMALHMDKWQQAFDTIDMDSELARMSSFVEAMQSSCDALQRSALALAEVYEEKTGIPMGASAAKTRPTMVAKNDGRAEGNVYLNNALDVVIGNTFLQLIPGAGLAFDIPDIQDSHDRLRALNRMAGDYPDCKQLNLAVFFQAGALMTQYVGALDNLVAVGALLACAAGVLVGGFPALVALGGISLVGVGLSLATMAFKNLSEYAYQKSIANDPGVLGANNQGCPGPELVIPSQPTKPIVDPSGFVYEAVESNRVSGATATVIEQVTYYDIYDEPYTEDEVWNGEIYRQKNPQVTDEDGAFAWDVPDGLWRVRVTKPGYASAETKWMEVPPERTDVRIGLVNQEPPKVERIAQTGDSLEVTMSRYVLADQLETAFTLKANDVEVPVTVAVRNAEESPEGALLASVAQVTPTGDISGADRLTLVVSGSLTSYAGISLGEDLTVRLKWNPCHVEAPERVSLLVGATKTLPVRVLPAGGTEGRTVKIGLLGNAVTANAVGTVDANGEAAVRVTGLALGVATLRLTVEGARAPVDVQVTCEALEDCDVLRLPEALTEVGEDAFRGSAAEAVVLPAGCSSVGSRAFAECPNLKYILAPAGEDVSFAPDAYDADSVEVLRY